MTAGLELAAIGKAFDGVHALHDVSFSVPAGSITGLMGPNGCGKSTVVDIVTGQIAPDHGSIRLMNDGVADNIIGLRPDIVAGLGIARCWSDVRLLGAPTVLDEVIIGAYGLRQASILGAMLGLGSARQDMRHINENARQLLELVGLGARANSRAEALSRGERARIGIARALASDPALLILDGPANGLPGEEITLITDLIHVLNDAGITILLAERNMKMIAECCGGVVAMNAGRVIALGSPTECFANPDVQRAYFGATAGGGT